MPLLPLPFSFLLRCTPRSLEPEIVEEPVKGITRLPPESLAPFEGSFLTGFGRAFGLGTSSASSGSVSGSGGGTFFLEGGSFEGPSPTSTLGFRVDFGLEGGGGGSSSSTRKSMSGIVTGLVCNICQASHVVYGMETHSLFSFNSVTNPDLLLYGG